LFGDFFKCDQLWYCLVWHNLGIQHIICYYYGNWNFLFWSFFGYTGRQMIEHTKKLVEDKFTTVGGYEHNAEVNQWLPCSCIYTICCFLSDTRKLKLSSSTCSMWYLGCSRWIYIINGFNPYKPLFERLRIIIIYWVHVNCAH
jgi:hypothetical protein